MDDSNKNEGEGSKSADKKYRDAATDFAKRTDTLQSGLQAEREVENYRDEFDRAEKTGRAHSATCRSREAEALNFNLRKDISGEDFKKKP